MRARSWVWLLIWVAGCEGSSAARWEILLDDALSPDDVVAVDAELVEGDCSAADPIQSYTLRPGDPAPMTPISLLEGQPYAIRGRARNVDCRVVAEGCLEIQAPIEQEVVTLLLEAVASPTDGCPGLSCVDSECVNLFDCTEADDGDACGIGETGVCTGGGPDGMICMPGTCGDGYVTAALGEECDDANGVSGDGCDDCRFTCSDTGECTDANACNGEEFCDAGTHTCVASMPLPDDTPCTRVGGDPGVCRGGACASPSCGDTFLDTGEECDDGNLEPGDGCENDCTFTCVLDETCDDGQPCNGVETCDLASHTCTDPPDETCDDGEVCTLGMCDEGATDGGELCSWSLIEDMDGDGFSRREDCDDPGLGGDCDDANPETYPGAPETCDMEDNDCDSLVDESAMPIECYLDRDGDGYGRLGDAVLLCSCSESTDPRVPAHPSGAFDCQDEPGLGGAQVNPSVTAYSASPYCVPNGMGCDDSWDWNCDGSETPRWGRPADCRCGIYRSGWASGSVPACGESAQWATCGVVVGSPSSAAPKGPAMMLNCEATISMRTQECR